MVQATLSRGTDQGQDSSATTSVETFRFMLLARVLDEKMASLYRTGKIHGGVFLGRGQEALSASIGVALRQGDTFAPLVRDTAGRLAFGEPVLDCVRTYLGSVLGPMRGRDGNVHRGRPADGIIPMISHLGAMISVVNGILFAKRTRGETDAVGVTCLGDGGTSTGAFHEGLNQAAVERLPLVMVVANNQYAYSTPTDHQFACESLADKAAGYGVTAHHIDGTDLKTCMATLQEAILGARAGQGPQLVVANLLRLCGHGEHDDASYITDKVRNSSVGRDCIEVAQASLVKAGLITREQLSALRTQCIQEVDQAVATAQREPAPDPFSETWRAISSGHLTEAFHNE
jgi:pyruvate dehydrogenase E1 component alpha subunit/2-oxoisovalerate dehydrogenase E1 component alpha subunit